jgi:hypothetical protein
MTKVPSVFDHLYNSFYVPRRNVRPQSAMPPPDDRPIGALEEIDNCAVKILTIRRRRENGDVETKTLKITLTLETEDHTVITLNRQGNRAIAEERGDLIITIRQAPHARERTWLSRSS